LELSKLRIEKDDIRYDIFNPIYEMINDNIQLRMKINNFIDAINRETNQRYEKMIQQSKIKEGSLKQKQETPGAWTTPGGEEEKVTKGGVFQRRQHDRAIHFQEKKDQGGTTKGWRTCT